MNAHLQGLNFQLSLTSLSRLMPMHAILGADGTIEHSGPTLAKLARDGFDGMPFFDAFDVSRPSDINGFADLWRTRGATLRLRMHHAPDVGLTGLALPLPEHGGLLLNLSFGIRAVDAVGRFNLSSGDFPPTDLTIEMLYLVEANAAVFAESRDLTKRLMGAKTAAEEQATTDTLTGLRNRRAMDASLERYLECGESFTLMHLDLDYFKAVNDTLGHAAGDSVLQEVSRILTEETRSTDTVTRFGGDEFVIILHRVTDEAVIRRVGKRILQRLEKPIHFEHHTCHISGSIGVTISTEYTPSNPAQMLIDADRALYASKNDGRACLSMARDIDLKAPIPQGDGAGD